MTASHHEQVYSHQGLPADGMNEHARWLDDQFANGSRRAGAVRIAPWAHFTGTSDHQDPQTPSVELPAMRITGHVGKCLLLSVRSARRIPPCVASFGDNAPVPAFVVRAALQGRAQLVASPPMLCMASPLRVNLISA